MMVFLLCPCSVVITPAIPLHSTERHRHSWSNGSQETATIQTWESCKMVSYSSYGNRCDHQHQFTQSKTSEPQAEQSSLTVPALNGSAFCMCEENTFAGSLEIQSTARDTVAFYPQTCFILLLKHAKHSSLCFLLVSSSSFTCVCTRWLAEVII